MSEVESFINDPQILRELIMDHYQYPHNHKLVKDDRYLSVHMLLVQFQQRVLQ